MEVRIGTKKRQINKVRPLLSQEQSEALGSFLQQNANVFAWLAVDMLYISPTVINHLLNVDHSTNTTKKKFSTD